MAGGHFLNKCRTLHLGNACWSSFAPASVTFEKRGSRCVRLALVTWPPGLENQAQRGSNTCPTNGRQRQEQDPHDPHPRSTHSVWVWIYCLVDDDQHLKGCER